MPPAAGRDQDPAPLAEVMALLDRLEEALGPFTTLPEAPDRPPADLLAAHLAAAEALGGTAERARRIAALCRGGGRGAGLLSGGAWAGHGAARAALARRLAGAL